MTRRRHLLAWSNCHRGKDNNWAESRGWELFLTWHASSFAASMFSKDRIFEIKFNDRYLIFVFRAQKMSSSNTWNFSTNCLFRRYGLDALATAEEPGRFFPKSVLNQTAIIARFDC